MIKKTFLSKAVALTLAVSSMLCVPVSAAASQDQDAANGIVKTITVTEDGKTIIEGMVSNPYGTSEDGISTQALAYGPLTQYPAEGGTWQYGFWNAKVRSYYTVNVDHGSSVSLNGDLVRSIDTAAGKQSVAEKWAIQLPGAVDKYYYRICD